MISDPSLSSGKQKNRAFHLILWIGKPYSFLKLARGLSKMHSFSPGVHIALSPALCMANTQKEACYNCRILALPKWLSQNLHFNNAEFEKRCRALFCNPQGAILVGSELNLVGCRQHFLFKEIDKKR